MASQFELSWHGWMSFLADKKNAAQIARVESTSTVSRANWILLKWKFELNSISTQLHWHFHKYTQIKKINWIERKCEFFLFSRYFFTPTGRSTDYKSHKWIDLEHTQFWLHKAAEKNQIRFWLISSLQHSTLTKLFDKILAHSPLSPGSRVCLLNCKLHHHQHPAPHRKLSHMCTYRIHVSLHIPLNSPVVYSESFGNPDEDLLLNSFFTCES